MANLTSDNVTTFSINQTTGALIEVGTEVLAGAEPDYPRKMVRYIWGVA